MGQLALGLLAMSASGTALAQGTVQNSAPNEAPNEGATTQDIIVTAERRSVNVQKAPLSVSVRTGQDLRNQGKYNLSQILENIPGVSGGASSGTRGGGTDSQETGIAIRGVPSNDSAGGSIVSSVPTTAVYVDDIYSGLGGTYDLDRVEVLRGPQGTLYGRSATAGLVATHTANPVLGDTSGWVLGEAGNYDLRHLSGGVNVPVGDKLAVRISGNHIARDGYDARDGGAFRTNEGRIKVLFKPTDAFTALVGAAFQDNLTHTGEYGLRLTAPDVLTKVPLGITEGKNRFRQYWAKLDWDLGPVSLTYIPAYRTWHQDADILVLGQTTLRQKQYTPKDNFLTQEFRASSSEGSKLTWQAGLFYYENKLDSQNTTTVDATGSLAFQALTNKTTRDTGVYAEATYPLTDTLRITGGLRYDYTYVRNLQAYTSNLNFPTSLPENNVTKVLTAEEATKRFKNFTYRARVEHDLSPDNLLFASISTGFLPGDVQVVTGAGNKPEAVTYSEETLKSYEIGSKNRFFDDVLQINAGAFYYDYGGYQTAVNVGSPFIPNFQKVTAPARMIGGEIEILIRPMANTRLGINASYVHAKFVDRTAEIMKIISQERVPNIPSTTGNAFAEHDIILAGGSSITLRGEVIYRSDYNLLAITQANLAANPNSSAYIRSKEMVVGNVNVGWTSADRKYSLSAYVRNVTNNRTASALFFTSFSPITATGTRTDPRTFGAVLQARF
ncbi:TonB-dependent receptor [Novosphingobium sp. Rr 2-17]|uniref:TonB-dependent receptor n=1 Tax=Novosphingobium sp. Rr 2-17 TaxID=555793 RepID=UPI0006937E61|nr:TonB-dependent receptor [Novosphingobium sp. Rr 2-17]